MLLRVADLVGEWLGPIIILAGIAGWFTGRIPHAFPSAAGIPAFGIIFCLLALMAAREEKKKLNLYVLAAAIVVGLGWCAYTYFGATPTAA